MLSAIIVNLPLIRNRRRRASAQGEDRQPLDLLSHDAEAVQIWIEAAADGTLDLQLFCPHWQTGRAGRVSMRAFGELLEVDYAAGSDTRALCLALARALDPWFDITLPKAPAASQRLHLHLEPKTHASLAASSTDGMVLLRCDGRGFHVEVGLDEPCASGGVITVAVAGRLLRFATACGQHGAEVVGEMARQLRALGGLVEIVGEASDGSYCARLQLKALLPQPEPQRATA